MSLRTTVLGSIALLCVAAYIIACRASFSPDGSRILVPFINSAPYGTAVALADLGTGKVRTVFTTAQAAVKDKTPDLGPLVVRWTPDGTRAVVFYPETEGEEHIRVADVPIDKAGEVRLFALPKAGSKGDALSVLAVQPPVVGDYALLSGEALLRLDLRTGELREAAPADVEGVVCAQFGGQAFYWCKKRAGGFEWGRVDPATLAFTPIVTIPQDIGGNLGMFAAPTQDGTHLAFVAEKGEAIVIFKGATFERKIEPPSGEGKWRFCNSVWSYDGKALYAAALRSGADGKGSCAVLEYPAEGGAMRELLALPGKVSEDDKGEMLLFQVELSPDGKTLAVPLTYIEVGDADRGLYLIDVASPGRTVKKIPIPGATASRS